MNVRWRIVVGALALFALAPPAIVLLATTRTTWPGAEPLPEGLQVEPLRLPVDDLTLDGWWIPAPEHRGTIVLLHGYGGYKARVANRMVWAHELGFDVLAVSLRGHGASAGWRTDLAAVHDAAAAIAEAHRRAPDQPVIAWGISLGAGLILQLGPHADVDRIVAEAPYRDLYDATRVRYAAVLPDALAPPLAGLTMAWAKLLLGEDGYALSPAERMNQLPPVPIRLIGGALDGKVAAADLQQMAERRPNSTLTVVADAGHHDLWLRTTDADRAALAAFLAGD